MKHHVGSQASLKFVVRRGTAGSDLKPSPSAASAEEFYLSGASPSRYICRRDKESSLWDPSLPSVDDKLDSFYATYWLTFCALPYRADAPLLTLHFFDCPGRGADVVYVGIIRSWPPRDHPCYRLNATSAGGIHRHAAIALAVDNAAHKNMIRRKLERKALAIARRSVSTAFAPRP
jgi:hypothetical protein